MGFPHWQLGQVYFQLHGGLGSCARSGSDCRAPRLAEPGPGQVHRGAGKLIPEEEEESVA